MAERALEFVRFRQPVAQEFQEQANAPLKIRPIMTAIAISRPLPRDRGAWYCGRFDRDDLLVC